MTGVQTCALPIYICGTLERIWKPSERPLLCLLQPVAADGPCWECLRFIQEERKSESMIKVASYNMRKALGTDRRRNPERILEVLNEIDADVIALQEADRRFGPRIAAIPAHLLELHREYKPVPLDVQVDSLGWQGHAKLVRKSAEILQHGKIGRASCRERVCRYV